MFVATQFMSAVFSSLPYSSKMYLTNTDQRFSKSWKARCFS